MQQNRRLSAFAIGAILLAIGVIAALSPRLLDAFRTTDPDAEAIVEKFQQEAGREKGQDKGAKHLVSKPVLSGDGVPVNDSDTDDKESSSDPEEWAPIVKQVDAPREATPPAPEIKQPELRPIPEKMKQEIALHKAPLDPRRITPGNFEYRGAFCLPLVPHRHKSRFSYGGFTLAFRPDGDPNGPDDGYPGSLFTVGHDSTQMVAEVSIPKPRYLVDKRGQRLRRGKLLQDFSDISDGFIEAESAGTEPFKIGGLFVSKNRLHWTLYKFYNVNGTRYDSHATSSLNIAKPQPEGLWHLGQMHGGGAAWHSYKYAGYIFGVPPDRIDDLGGLDLISGLQMSTGRQTSSQGPAMYAYTLPERGTPSGASLDAIPLVYYPLGGGELASHSPADKWRGGAWLKVGRKEGIVIVGRKALGELYYGSARASDCTVDKGYHGTPYEPQMLFYDWQDIQQVANGKKRPWMVEPYLRWTHLSPGGGLKEYMFNSCHGRVEGMALDRANQLLYLIQFDATFVVPGDVDKYPVVHVFKLKDV